VTQFKGPSRNKLTFTKYKFSKRLGPLGIEKEPSR
jgi:hypothetical protein